MLNLIVYIKMDLALNNLQRLICHKKSQPTNQPIKLYYLIVCKQMNNVE